MNFNWRRIGIVSVVVILFLWVLAIPLLWPYVAVPSAMWTGVVFYLLTMVGITVIYHRSLTHGSVRLKPWAHYTGIFLAMLSLEGSPLDWCANHRMHHRHSDQDGDPHSPHLHGAVRGFFHAHFLWFCTGDYPDYKNLVPDLLRDKGIVRMSRLTPVVNVLSFLLPGLIVLAIEQSARGFWAGVFWGGPIRIFLAHHVTWSINSICHLWGKRPFKTRDQSANNWIFGILGGGEGWHNNHHAFQTSARIGLYWWQFDAGWLVIKFLNLMGQVEHMRTPSLGQIESKRI